MDYKKIDLQEPIDEIQEAETPKQHYFLELFYDVEDDNFRAFYKSFEGLDKGDVWEYGGCTETLKFKPFAQSTFRNLGCCLQYLVRRKAHWTHIFESRKECPRHESRFCGSLRTGGGRGKESGRRYCRRRRPA